MPVDAAILDADACARLNGARFGRVLQLAETASTNSVAAGEAVRGAPEGLVVVADYQSAGRGRFDRSWEAPPGKSLLFSVLARPTPQLLPPPRRHLAVAALAMALREAVASVSGVELALKWPNDLVEAASLGNGAPERKAAGLLAESLDGALVIGAGLNVSWAPRGAVCVEELAGEHVDRGELLVAALLEMSTLYGDWDRALELYRSHCATLGREVIVSFAGDEPELRGTAVDVGADGALLVSQGTGAAVVVAAADVRHARPAAPRVRER